MRDEDVTNWMGQGREGAASQPPRPAVEGTALSNTVPGNSNGGGNTRLLRTGIDSLYLSYPGSVNTDVGIKLQRCKELAQSEHKEAISLAQYELGGHTFEVNDKGRGIFPYVLRDGWYQLQVSKPEAKRKPMAFAVIASGLLTTQSLSYILGDLRVVVGGLGEVLGSPSVSRVDLCCDFTTDYPFETLRDSNWVTRARLFSRYSENKLFTGFSIGAGGYLSARLYNKTIELQKNPRPYLTERWEAAGWDDFQDVWRLEFQFRREILKELGINTVDTLEAALAGLWRYATQEWLRLVIPSESDSTAHRWPLAPVWELLQGASWSGAPQYARNPPGKARAPSERQLYERGLDGLVSFMALYGYSDYQEGVPAFVSAARTYHDARAPLTDRDFRGYLLERVKGKQRQYNTAVNIPHDGIHPATQAAAAAYRRARDGG